MTDGGECRVFVLDPDPGVLAAAPIYREMETAADRVLALARAVESSPGFRTFHDAVLVARLEEPLRLAVLGRFTPAEQARLGFLVEVVRASLGRLRYVTWADAERAASVLAGRLADRLGAAAIAGGRFQAIPRGGIFVLGMLAYLLDLRPEQLGPRGPSAAAEPRNGEGPLVLVDDCALTGLRFRAALESAGPGPVVFAHLASHPALRSEIERREPRVSACVAAEDLEDLLPPGTRLAWERRWRERSDPGVYWLGLTDHVCFPWNEPDVSVWNDTSGTEEAPWRVVPPEFCLKNRAGGDAGSRLQVQAESRGPVGLAAGALLARLSDRIVVADCVSGNAYGFEAVAAEILDGLVGGASPREVAERLASEYEIEVGRAREDVEALIAEATGLGLLTRRDAGAGGAADLRGRGGDGGLA
ncbi:MAG: PqqD family protein [Gemmatimonadota bacterium]